MWIYKITNIQNNKVYIGQTIRPINQRFHRHLNDAINNILDTHFARAIRKYGKDNFIIEEIDTAQTQDELNQKEQYWIRFYNSVEEGYNETDAISKCGGNTYRSKTEEEMEIIKEKIRQTKIGTKNPMARKIKRTNIITNEVPSTPPDCFYEKSVDVQPAASSIQETVENNYKMLRDKYGAKKLKCYSIVFKVIFIICLLFTLFALLFSIPFAIIFGILTFISFKYSSLYKKASNYSE